VGGVNLEGGVIWGNGMFAGIDFDFAWEEPGGQLIGGGFGLGNTFNLGKYVQFVYGGLVGFWYGIWPSGDYEANDSYDFIAPFVKLRWKFLELSYRGLSGVSEGERLSYQDEYKTEYEADYRFHWNHQLMLGFYFATSTRKSY